MRVYLKFLRLFLVLMVGFLFIVGCGSSGGDDKDTTAPVITLNGKSSQTIFVGDSYKELGAKAVDNVDGNVKVKISGKVDVTKIATYIITYKAEDKAGNEEVVKRTIHVVLAPDTTKPIIILKGATPQSLTKGSKYNELGATATDDRDGATTVSISGKVDISKVGTYTITYKAIQTK
jgi:flavin-binding protein dodecin